MKNLRGQPPPGARSGAPIRTPVLLALAFATAFCAHAINVHSATSPTARFYAYRTFAFRVTENAPRLFRASAISTEVSQRVQVQASEALEAKGYHETTEPKPDLILWVGAGRRERESQHDETHNAPWINEREDDDFVEGAFVIDAFDGVTHEQVWHGSARTQVDPGRIDSELLQRAVQSVMARFPARAEQPPAR
jgi:hypothetical protein